MRYRLANPLAWRLVEGQVFAITPDGMLHVLEEPTGAHLFSALATKESSRQELLDELLAEFDVAPEQASSDLDEFLSLLLAKHLIGVVPE